MHRILPKTAVAGPGNRFCLWVQGCSRRCSGCMMPQTWPSDVGEWTPIKDIFTQVVNTKGIEGITFLGGEPFEQPEAVNALAKLIKGKGLSIMMFTGFCYEQLMCSQDQHVIELLENVDLLVDGAFNESLFDLSRPWVGSSNQVYHFLTGRYNAEDLAGIKNKLEVRISPQGEALVNGMGDFNGVKNFLRS